MITFVFIVTFHTVPATKECLPLCWAGLLIPQALIPFVWWFVFCVFSGFLQLVSWLQLAHQWGSFSLLLSIKQSSTLLWQEMNWVWAQCVNVSYLALQYTFCFPTLPYKHTTPNYDIGFVFQALLSLYNLFFDIKILLFASESASTKPFVWQLQMSINNVLFSVKMQKNMHFTDIYPTRL